MAHLVISLGQFQLEFAQPFLYARLQNEKCAFRDVVKKISHPVEEQWSKILNSAWGNIRLYVEVNWAAPCVYEESLVPLAFESFDCIIIEGKFFPRE